MFIVPQRTLPSVFISLLLALGIAIAAGSSGSPEPDAAPEMARADAGRAPRDQAAGTTDRRPIAAARPTPMSPLAAPLPPPG